MKTIRYAPGRFVLLVWLLSAAALSAQPPPANAAAPVSGAPTVPGPSLQTDSFPVDKKTADRLTGATGLNSSADSSADPFAAVPNPATPRPKPDANPLAGEATAIHDFFQNAGVDFAGVPGSKMDYDGSVITVTQTARNIEKIGNILVRYKDITQVSIETHFIEVNESDLAGLDFSQYSSSDRVIRPRVAVVAASAGPAGGVPAVRLADPVTLFTGILQSNALANVLGEKSGVLHRASTVTVVSGNPASIQVADEVRYPPVVVPGVSTTPSIPQEFTTRNIGLELRITPTIEDDNSSIGVEYEFRAATLEGFIKLGGVPSGPVQSASLFQSVTTGLYKAAYWDGATVVLRFPTQQSTDPKSPPRCLLVFLTVNLVFPGGSLKKQHLTQVLRNANFQEKAVVALGGDEPRRPLAGAARQP